MSKRAALNIFLVLFLISPFYAFGKGIKGTDEIEELKREIILLNLINGLNLIDSQAAEIIRYAKEAKTIRDSAMDAYKSIETELKASFTELRDSLYDRNSSPSLEVEERAQRLNHNMKEKKEKMIKKLKEIEEKVKLVLTQGQIEILQEFKPCLIPPNDLKNPTRAGHAFDSTPFERLLENVRRIPDEKYALAKQMITNRYIKKIEKYFGEISDADKEAYTANFFDVIQQARNMTPEEFAINKKELSLMINPEKEDIEKIKALAMSRKGLSRIGHFLLDEKIITILQKRLALSKGAQPTGNKGLANLKDPNNGRSCAIKMTTL